MTTEQREGSSHSGKLENIALSLSGGGVRAVGFHLGLLEMLERLDLLKRVRILSTVSGGSLTGTGYALSQHFGHSFDRYFGEFYEFLPEINTIEVLLAGLSGKKTPSPTGRRDLITVLANLYNDSYFEKYYGEDARAAQEGTVNEGSVPRFGLFWDKPHPTGHLSEIIFNATEFETGNAFRFQKSDFRSLIGNANIYLCEEHAQQIRIADIMAASSCIPVGMEPLFFPDDFHWPDDVGTGPNAERPTCNVVKDHLRENLHRKFLLHGDTEVDFFALMDGGVYDNQGILSLLLAMNRLVTKVDPEVKDHCVCGKSLYLDVGEPAADSWAKWIVGDVTDETERDFPDLEDIGWDKIDLLIVSDTPVRKDSLYPKLPTAQNAKDPEDVVHLIPEQHRTDGKGGVLRNLTIGGLEKLLFAGSGLLLASAALTGYEEVGTDLMRFFASFRALMEGLLQVGIPLLVTGGVGIGLFLFRRRAMALSKGLYGILPKDRWGKKKPWGFIKKIRIVDALSMLNLRVGSTAALTANIYMNRIRALSYSALFSRKDLDQHVITNEIFALEVADDGRPSEWPEDFPEEIGQLSADANALIMLAAHMKTKLWINRIDKGVASYAESIVGKDPLSKATRRVLAMNERRVAEGAETLTDLDVLVISGQLTSCFKLMAYMWEQNTSEGGGWKHESCRDLFDRTCALWERAREDPTCLLDERKERAQRALSERRPASRTVVLS